MPVDVVLGLQFGDEGKGKIVDYLCQNKKILAVVRTSGANNAGHTCIVGDRTFKLHQIPSGILSGKHSYSGNGTLINLEALTEELNGLEKLGIDISLYKMSNKAHLIMPWHIAKDKSREEGSSNPIGTTQKGIGPAYESKVNRTGIRVEDILDEELFVRKWLEIWNINKFPESNPGIKTQTAAKEYRNKFLPLVKKHIAGVTTFVNDLLKKGNIISEGAQAFGLDLDHGTYPYVTSSSPSIGGVCTGLGISPKKIGQIFGVCKSYSTRVGNGPFPTEIEDEISIKIREIGHEYGTTTGRPRRVGYLDLTKLKYAIELNGVDSLCLTKLDVLSGFKTLKICHAYYAFDKQTNFPQNLSVWPEMPYNNIEPLYTEFAGWDENISKITKFKNLPANCKKYVEFIMENIGEAELKYIGVGPERDDLILL